MIFIYIQSLLSPELNTSSVTSLLLHFVQNNYLSVKCKFVAKVLHEKQKKTYNICQFETAILQNLANTKE